MVRNALILQTTRGTPEKLEQFGEKSDVLDVQAQNGMAEVPVDEQEKSSAATEIEHAFRLGTMEFQILHAFPI